MSRSPSPLNEECEVRLFRPKNASFFNFFRNKARSSFLFWVFTAKHFSANLQKYVAKIKSNFVFLFVKKFIINKRTTSNDNQQRDKKHEIGEKKILDLSVELTSPLLYKTI